MPSVNIVDLNNAPVGSIELSDVVFGAEVNEALLYEAVRQYTLQTRRQCGYQDAPRSVRFGQKVVEAERYRPRPYGLDSFATLASRRHHARTATPQL